MPSQDAIPSMPYRIALCHQKGGVGKSTTAAALGACLASEHRQPVLLLDLDPSANLTAGFGLRPEAINGSLADLVTGRQELPPSILHTTIPELDILPSNPNMLSLSRSLFGQQRYEYLLRDLLQQPCIQGYKFVFIDCPPMLDSLTISALTAADLVLIPTQCEYYSLQSLDNVFRLIKLVRAKTNPKLRYRLLITMFDQRGRLHARVLSMVRQHYDNALLNTIIGFDNKIRESQLAGVPITLYAPKTRAAMQYQALAQEIQVYVQR